MSVFAEKCGRYVLKHNFTLLLKRCNIELDANGVPMVNDNHESSVQNLFIAGDILYKSGGSIAKALNAGFDIVKHVHELMNK